MQGKWLSVGLMSLMAACAPNTFTDRPARLHFATAKAGPAETERGVVEAYRALPTSNERRNRRDSIVWSQLAADDDDFNAFVRRVRSDRALMNMSSDGGVILLNGLAATLGTAAEKAALSTLSAGLLSARGSVDKQLFSLETMSALLARMKAARLTALVPIRIGLRQSEENYPLEQALVDLRSYADAGSLLSTIETITTDAGKATLEAEAEIKPEVRGEAYLNSLPAREELADRVDALKGNQLIALAFAMERYRSALPESLAEELRRTDPSDARFRDAVRAKAFLLTWLIDGTDAGSPEWSDAVTLAEKGRP